MRSMRKEESINEKSEFLPVLSKNKDLKSSVISEVTSNPAFMAVNEEIIVVSLISKVFDKLGDIAGSYIELQKEREETKRVYKKAEVLVRESDNRLMASLAQNRVEMFKIQKDFELKMKELENEREKNRFLYEIISKIIAKIDIFEEKFNLYKGEYGLKDEKVMNLISQLHELNMALIKQIPAMR